MIIFSDNHISMPCDVTSSPDGELYITCEDGTWMSSNTETEDRPRRRSSTGSNMHRPGCMAVTSHGHVIISDGRHPSLLIYDAASLTQIDTINLDNVPGLKADNVCSLAGIFVDRYSYIYIADTNNNRIIVLNITYDVTCVLDTKDWFDDAVKEGNIKDIQQTMNGPVGVAVDEDCHLVVLEKRGTVKVFRHMLAVPKDRKALFPCCM